MLDFNNWDLFENFGSKSEIFTEKLGTYKLNNLDIYGSISSWGDELDTAIGTLTYKIELDVTKSGIESINYTIEKIELEMEFNNYKDEDSDPESVSKSLVINKDQINLDKTTLLINEMPFYIDTLEIDFSDAENVDGELELDKVQYTLVIGKIKD